MTNYMPNSRAKRRKTQNSYAKVHSLAWIGVDGALVEIECQQSVQLPGFFLVGMPQNWARETRERVLGALHACGFTLPSRRIVINLSPVHAGGEGVRAFDLAIAIACLVASGVIAESAVTSAIFLGELTLSGELKAVRAAAMLPRLMRTQALQGAYVPIANAACLESMEAQRGGGFRTLTDVVTALQTGKKGIFTTEMHPPPASLLQTLVRLENIRGQSPAKRMLKIAAAGEHHALLAGPRGVGKSMLANALPGLLPPLDTKLRDEIATVYNVAGQNWDGGRPYRMPHASVTAAAMLGGGGNCSPGELSLAHGGVIFLDELLEFPRETLESLRISLETGEIRLARGETHVSLPARAQLIAATNLCECGVWGAEHGDCRCPQGKLRWYRHRLSYALRDRFDLKLELNVQSARLSEDITSESVRTDVMRARAFMLARQGEPNARLSSFRIFALPGWDRNVQSEVERVAEKQRLSLRGLTAIARVARTIADLEGSEVVAKNHVLEAAHYQRDPLAPA